MKSSPWKIILQTSGILFVFLTLFSSQALALTVDDIASNLICQCGCTMVVTSCQCGTADQTRVLIQEKIDKGESKVTIIKYFVDQYGEKVLASPTKKGFNITAWIIPFVAIVVGGGIIFLVVRKWVSSHQAEKIEIQKAVAQQNVDEKYRIKLEEELRSFE